MPTIPVLRIVMMFSELDVSCGLQRVAKDGRVVKRGEMVRRNHAGHRPDALVQIVVRQRDFRTVPVRRFLFGRSIEE